MADPFGSTPSHRRYASIEKLPLELKQIIWKLSLNPDLARASPTLSRDLTTDNSFLKDFVRKVCTIVPVRADWPDDFMRYANHRNHISQLLGNEKPLETLLNEPACNFRFLKRLVDVAKQDCLQTQSTTKHPPRLALGGCVPIPERFTTLPLTEDDIGILEMILEAGSADQIENRRVALLLGLHCAELRVGPFHSPRLRILSAGVELQPWGSSRSPLYPDPKAPLHSEPADKFLALFEAAKRKRAAPLQLLSPFDVEVLLKDYVDGQGSFSEFTIKDRLLYVFTGYFRGQLLHSMNTVWIDTEYEFPERYPIFWDWVRGNLRVKNKQMLMPRSMKGREELARKEKAGLRNLKRTTEGEESAAKEIAQLREWFRYRAKASLHQPDGRRYAPGWTCQGRSGSTLPNLPGQWAFTEKTYKSAAPSSYGLRASSTERIKI